MNIIFVVAANTLKNKQFKFKISPIHITARITEHYSGKIYKFHHTITKIIENLVINRREMGWIDKSGMIMKQ